MAVSREGQVREGGPYFSPFLRHFSQLNSERTGPFRVCVSVYFLLFYFLYFFFLFLFYGENETGYGVLPSRLVYGAPCRAEPLQIR